MFSYPTFSMSESSRSQRVGGAVAHPPSWAGILLQSLHFQGVLGPPVVIVAVLLPLPNLLLSPVLGSLQPRLSACDPLQTGG
jgi:hypothetical protein